MIFLIFFLISIVNPSTSFNLETRLPVIKIGDKDSYFGYSIAAHQSLNELGQVDKSWILVGAPKGDNLQPGTNKSGALFKCPLTTYFDDCVQVVTDGRRHDPKNLIPPGDDEIKNDQWLGVTVRSQGPGGKVMVCAHRYVSRGPEFRWGRGLCYTLKQFLDFDYAWDPCKGKPTGGAHEEYGFCQVGTSGMVFDDTAIMGSPGPMTWRGTVFILGITDDYFRRDKITYMVPVTEETAPVKKYSYLGMSVTAGHFYGDNVTTYAAGAPRGGDSTGQVVLFTKDATPGQSLLKVQSVINGEQFTSSFGYEICTADVNGDRKPDLLVAAPFYFGRNIGGAVYIYLNSADHCLTCKPPLKLTGKLESRFGFALANLGDINKDGYDDIAIGAPYEGDGAVYVYLGSADGLIPEPSQVIRPSNIQSPKPIVTFGYSLSGGVDLDQNGYPDLVIGAYEQDLVVLLRARPIIGLMISYGPETNLRNIDPNQLGCADNQTSLYTCFGFETCCTIESVIKSQLGGRKLQLKYTIEAETFDVNQKFSRIWFNNSISNSTNINEQILYIDKGDNKYCQKHVAYLKKNVHDIQTPISMKISYALVDPEVKIPSEPGYPLPSLEDLPILNQQQADKVFQASFHNDCGGDICHSQLITEKELRLKYSDRSKTYELILGEVTDLQINVTVTNMGDSAYEAYLYVICPANVTYISGITSLSETCQPIDNIISCNLGNPLKSKNNVLVTFHFDLSKLDDLIQKTEFIIFANSTSREDEPQGNITIPITVLKETLISVVGRSSPDSEFELEAGVIKGESEIKILEEIGPEILHTYTIYNTGTWYVSNLDIHIEWPYQMYNNGREGKWLLYLTDKPEIDVAGSCDVNASVINPVMIPSSRIYSNIPFTSHSVGSKLGENGKLNFSNSNALYNRVRRSAHYVAQPEVFKSKSGRNEKVVNMNCLLNTARCIKMICKIDRIKRNEAAKITIKSRLWNSTLLQDYSNVDVVRITSRAKVHNVPSLSPNEFHVQTVIRVNILGPQTSEPVPLFIIIAAIVIGLLIFILLTLLLWKFGFFKRRRPNALLSGNVEKQHFDY